MKTKKLIELLQLEDPSGEEEVVVATSEGNIDIHFVEMVEGYWDGAYQVLERSGRPECYDVIGAKLTNAGRKMRIKLHSIEDVLIDNPNMPIEVVDHSSGNDLQKQVDEWRKEAVEANIAMTKFLQKDRLEREEEEQKK